MTKLLRNTVFSALALLFVACDASEDEVIQELAAELHEDGADADGLVVPYQLVADEGEDDAPADPTPFFDLDRLTTEDPGCATGGEDSLDLAAADADADADADDLDLALDLGDTPDPGADPTALDLVAAGQDPSAAEADEDEDLAEDLPLKADVDPTEEDTSGFEDEPEFAGA